MQEGFTMKAQIIKFLKEEDGITALEYGILAAIVVAAIVAIFGTRLEALFNTIMGNLEGAVPPAG
jgi:pilus assembly protein Flp/PilA